MGTVFFQRQVSLASLVITLVASDNSSAAQTGRSSASSSAPITVVIDAGHGGHDRGGIPGQSVAEKEMTLDVAQRLRNVLAASGYRVVMTRDSDVFVPLGTRVESPIPTATRSSSVSTSTQQNGRVRAASKHIF